MGGREGRETYNHPLQIFNEQNPTSLCSQNQDRNLRNLKSVHSTVFPGGSWLKRFQSPFLQTWYFSRPEKYKNCTEAHETVQAFENILFSSGWMLILNVGEKWNKEKADISSVVCMWLQDVMGEGRSRQSIFCFKRMTVRLCFGNSAAMCSFSSLTHCSAIKRCESYVTSLPWGDFTLCGTLLPRVGVGNAGCVV